MKKVILSFDYELFFGAQCGTVDGCLITPTQKILEALRLVGGCAVFFIDYLMLKRMWAECNETRQQARRIEKQLKDIVRSGSRIEMHLHPHWVDSKYMGNGKWDFSNYTHYCLDSLPKNEVRKMFEEGVEYLNGIAREVDPNYRVIAFRAGGWAVQPFDHLKDGFMASGIKVDSSVCTGMVLNGVNYKLDFTNSPKVATYHFSTDILTPDANGQFLEVQISSFKFNPITYMLDGLYRKFNRRKYRHHETGSYMTNGRRTNLKRLPIHKRSSRRSMFGIDTTSKILYFFHLICSRRPLTVGIGHPKDLNDLALENIAFLGRRVMFVTYNDLIH